jgi:hypothetical protein
MNFSDFLTLAPKLAPLMPRLIKAVQTLEAMSKSPDVKDAIAVIEEASVIVQAQFKGTPS